MAAASAAHAEPNAHAPAPAAPRASATAAADAALSNELRALSKLDEERLIPVLLKGVIRLLRVVWLEVLVWLQGEGHPLPLPLLLPSTSPLVSASLQTLVRRRTLHSHHHCRRHQV